MYLIKTIYTPTESNKNFKEIQVWYEGKNGQVERAKCVDVCGKLYCNASNYFLKYYGYTRLQDAKRKLKSELESAKKEMEFGTWNITKEIVEF